MAAAVSEVIAAVFGSDEPAAGRSPWPAALAAIPGNYAAFPQTGRLAGIGKAGTNHGFWTHQESTMDPLLAGGR